MQKKFFLYNTTFFLTLLMFLFSFANISADEIHLIDNSIIKGKITIITDTVIKYNSEGKESSAKEIEKKQVKKIKYDDGREEILDHSVKLDAIYLYDGTIIKAKIINIAGSTISYYSEKKIKLNSVSRELVEKVILSDGRVIEIMGKSDLKEDTDIAKEEEKPVTPPKEDTVKKKEEATVPEKEPSIKKFNIFVGANIQFIDWHPRWEKNFSTNVNSFFLYGPSLDFVINDAWIISIDFLYGNTSAKWHDFYWRNQNSYLYKKTTEKINTFETNLLLSYNINNNIKIFVGPYYKKYKYIDDTIEIYSTFSNPDTVTYSFHNFGSQFGSTFTINILPNFNFLTELSGFVLFGINYKATSYGFNINPSLTYTLANINTDINLGFRYQLLIYGIYNGYTPEKKNEHLYGLTFSLTYRLK